MVTSSIFPDVALTGEEQSLVESIKDMGKWVPCDCGCETLRPENAATIAYARAANRIRLWFVEQHNARRLQYMSGIMKAIEDEAKIVLSAAKENVVYFSLDNFEEMK